MKKELKEKWVKALRSGKYKQGEGCLRSENSAGNKEFCCLGVLADLIDPEGWDAVELSSHRLGKRGESHSFLKTNIIRTEIQNDLAELNDGGYSFEEIAEQIDRRIKGT